MGLSLRRNFACNLVGNVVYAACQWGMFVALARTTSAESVGQFALGLAVAAPIFLFSQFQLRGIQATDARKEFTFQDYFGLRLTTSTLALAAAAVAGALGYGGTTAWIVLAVAIAKAIESLGDVFYGLMQRHERMDIIAVSRTLKGLLSLGAMWAVLWATGDVLFGVLAMAAAWGVAWLAFDGPKAMSLLAGESGGGGWLPRPSFCFRKMAKLFKLALPLGLASVLISLQTNVPRYFVEHYGGTSELGIYAALAYLVLAGGMVVMAMGQSATPRLAQLHAQGNRRAYFRLLRQLLGLGAGLAVAGMFVAVFFGEYLLGLLYGEEYARKSDVLVWLMAGGGFAYLVSFSSCGILAARRFFVQLPIMAASVGATALSAALLVPSRGMMGGAMAFLVGNVTALLLHAGVLVWIYFGTSRMSAEPECRAANLGREENE